MSKLYEYTVTFEDALPGDDGKSIVIDATDASHAYSEVVDEYGPEYKVVSIVRGEERPYGTDS